MLVLGIAAGCNSLTGATDVSFVDLEPTEEDAGSSGAVVREKDAAPPPQQDAGTVPVDAGAADADADAGPRGPLRAFVTSQTWTGNLGGLAGAAALCKQAADAAGLGGQWVAWLSTNGNNAVDRLTGVGPWQLVDGTVIATNKVDLTDGAMPQRLRRTEKNQVIDTLDDRVWTATNPNGTATAPDCNGWTANANARGIVGQANEANGAWTNLDTGANGEGCGNTNRLYCFEL